VQCPAAGSALGRHGSPPRPHPSLRLPAPEHLLMPFPTYSGSCTPAAAPMGPQLCRGHVCNQSSNYFCVYLCRCTTCDLNMLLAALEIGGAEQGMLQLTPPPWTKPLACCAVLADQNTKDSLMFTGKSPWLSSLCKILIEKIKDIWPSCLVFFKGSQHWSAVALTAVSWS